ncbi:MBL fold metallo-hydrolase [Oceanibacterium hippocampi]|uniref:Beta-lactamase type II n=1 Tax=Oceanibacterium hippocampi TaxID=745714 RepID=A0A1Y5SWG0_9PROT|nr:MBL fold metallo-hydrolase [Oceanibacterium hippocampi]SLN49592.1 Beta-lactamase type II precursor [Oceanibacterium hippocampi]
MSRQFASKGDLAPKKVTFEKLTDNAYSYSAEGDPTSGVIVGDDGVMVVDTRSTPVAAEDLIARVRTVTDKPVRYVVLTHYHAVRVLGASAYGAEQVIASEMTREMIAERGEADYKSEVERFPRLFEGVESVPGLTWPTITFRDRMTIWLGGLEVQLMHLGRGHTKGDIVAWLPESRVLFSGDLVENGATPYTGDAHLKDWPGTLARVRALKPKFLIPGRGDALKGAAACEAAIAGTQGFLEQLYSTAEAGVAEKASLKEVYGRVTGALRPKYGHWAIFDHCMPFDVARAYDEASGIDHPRIWTAERDIQMWKDLEGA